MSIENREELAASSYQQEGIRTADPLNLVLRVYELSSLNAARARSALSTGDLSAKGRAVHRLSRCLSLLQTSLDMERGGEVARNLDRLYSYLQRRLSEGHLRNDDAAFVEIAGHLTELGSAWREAARQPREPQIGNSVAEAVR